MKIRVRISYLLVVLGIVPLLGGIVRLSRLGSSGEVVSADDARFVENALPVVLHILFATTYAIAGAFQFDDRLRRERPAWHRRAGRVIAVFGFFAAVTGVWMTVAYAIPAPLQGELLYVVRLIVGSAMAVFIVLGVAAIVGRGRGHRRDVRAHEAWMVRAYALGVGAGTQALLFLPVTAVMAVMGSELVGVGRDVLMTVAWGMNVVVAEWVIWRRGVGEGAGAGCGCGCREVDWAEIV